MQAISGSRSYIAQKESGFPKGRVSSRCNDVTTVTNTFFSFGIVSTIYYIKRYNMLYREIFSSKVLTMQPNIYGTNIFWWCSKKSATSVTMEKNGPSLVSNNWNICRPCILKEKKSSIAKQTETSCDRNNISDKYFRMIQQKKRDKCRQMRQWKKKAHPWSETTVTFVDNVF